MDTRPVTFITGLFRQRDSDEEEEEDNPCIREEVFQEYCSLFAADGVPNNIREDPHVAEIIRLSDEELNDIAQTQIQRENQRKEEEKNKEEKGKLEQKIKTKLDSKVDEIFDEKAFYLRKQCPVKIPFKSTLSHEEHDAYLRVFLKIKEKPVMTLRQTAEYKHYLSLQHRVYEEQSNFMQFSHQVATLQLKNYNTVPEVITNYIDEYVEHRCKRALKYKEHYITEQQVPIRPQDPKRHFSKLSFTHIGHLLSLGTLPQFKIPYKCKLHELKIDDTVSKRERLSRSVTHDKNALTDTPVSVDRNAEYLAQQHQANIVISTSALKVLADNHGPNFDKEWDIPVEVKSYSVKDPDGRQIQHRVVYIDKPLPKKTWTPLEKQQLFFKKAFLATFTEIKQSKKFRLHPPPLFHYSEPDQGGCVGDAADAASRTVTKYDDDFFSLSHTTDTDVFGDESVGKTELITRTKNRKMNKKGIRTSPSTTKLSRSKAGKPQPPEGRAQDGKGNSNKRPQQLEVRDILPKAETTKNDDVTRTSEHFLNSEKYSKNQCSSDKGSTVNTCMTKKAGKQETSKNNSRDFLEDLLSMQGSLLKPLPTQGDEAEDQKDEASKSNKIPLRPWTNKLSTKWETLFEPHVCKYWTGKNVHYQLFSLGPDASQPTNSLWPMRVLVRSNLHGRSHFKFDKEKCKEYISYAKVENQAYFGAEVNTLSEITQQWVQLLIRPNTTLLQLRVCEGSGEILMTEDKDLAEILKDGKQLHVGFQSCQPLATFYSVFSAVLTQQTGHYLLHHDPKTEAFIQLMKAADLDKEAYVHMYNLHKAYAAPSVSTRLYTVPPWLAIDTHVLTPFHKKHRKIPGTFPMNNPKRKLTNADRKKINIKAKKKKTLVLVGHQNDEERSAF